MARNYIVYNNDDGANFTRVRTHGYFNPNGPLEEGMYRGIDTIPSHMWDALRYTNGISHKDLINKEPQVGGKKMDRFKVGDKVRVIKLCSGPIIDNTYTIIKIDSSPCPIQIDYNDGFWVYASSIEHLNTNSKPLTQRQSEIERLKGEISKRDEIISKAQDENKEIRVIIRKYKKYPTKEAEFAGLLGDLTNKKTSKKAIASLVECYGMKVGEDKIKY